MHIRKSMAGCVKVILLVLLLYVVTYVALSRISLAIMRNEGLNAIYYVPVTLDTMSRSASLLRIHYILSKVFYPLWFIDFQFGGPGILHAPLDRISMK